MIPAVALAMTPMVLYTASVVNPSALEIPAALCLWVSALVLVADLDGASDGRLVARVGVSGALLGLSRGLSPLWLLVIAVVTLPTARRSTLTRLIRRRGVQLCAVGLVAATGLAAAWLVLAGTLDVRDAPRHTTESVTSTVRASLGDTDADVRAMIGRFGWLDIEVPALTRYMWLSAAGAGILAALAVGRRRYVVALVILLLAVVAIPVVLETVQAPKLGMFWSGRYTLPLAVGVPPLAALAIADRVGEPSNLLYRLVKVFLGTLAFGQVLAYMAAARRYGVGTSGPVMYLFNGNAWRPPLPAWALLAGFVGAAAAMAMWLQRLAAQPAGDDSHASASASAAEESPWQGRTTTAV